MLGCLCLGSMPGVMLVKFSKETAPVSSGIICGAYIVSLGRVWVYAALGALPCCPNRSQARVSSQVSSQDQVHSTERQRAGNNRQRQESEDGREGERNKRGEGIFGNLSGGRGRRLRTTSGWRRQMWPIR